MARKPILATVCATVLLLAANGCAPRIRVTANPTAETNGIRYYRPKPYLKVVPAEVQFAKDASRIEPALVRISLEYLPDFSEEYAVDVRPGLGLAEVSLTLEDGWNLTEINQELDSQTDENLSAAGDLIKAVSGLVPTAAEATESPQIAFTVPATDVPLGYYESVIGRGPDGRKRLYGFRYLGFLPYQSCPTEMGGVERACCGDPHSPLYGLTFDSGRMVFKPLAAMAAAPLDASVTTAAAAPTPVATPVPSVSPAPDVGPVSVAPPAAEPWAIASRIELDLRDELQRSYPSVRSVHAEWKSRDGSELLRVRVRMESDVAGDVAANQAIRQLALETLAAWLPGTATDVEIE